MSARRHCRRDLGEMQVHRRGVAARAGPGPRPCPAWGRWRRRYRSRRCVDRAAPRAGAAPGPAAGDLVLLADAGLVGEPDLYAARRRRLVARDLRPGARGSFFKILDGAVGLGMMARAGGELAIAHGAQFPAQGLLGDGDAEFLPDPLAQIDQPPAHHAMNRRDRAALDHLRKRCAMGVVELRRVGPAPCGRSARPAHRR